MGFLLDIFYFIIVISILVTVHELGHFLAARLTGMRADVFSIGMGKRLFGFNKITGFTAGRLPQHWEGNGHTDYRISLLPIGGYVKIAGMVDESLDTSSTERSQPEPWEFRAKGTWAKVFVLTAGVIMNFLLAIIVFALIAFFIGEYHESTTEVGYVQENSLLEKAGFRTGDKIKSINGFSVKSWSEVIDYLTLKEFGKEREVTIVRNGEPKVLSVSGDKLVRTMADSKSLGIFKSQTQTVITQSIVGGPAWDAGIRANDTIVSINGEQIGSYAHFQDVIKSNKNREVNITWKHENGETKSATLIPNEDGMIQVGIASVYTGDYYHKTYPFFSAIANGTERTINSTQLIISSVGQIFSGNISFRESVGGPITIAKEATKYAEQGILSFLLFLALLSISLAILNILPFPALDGGHLVFVIIEGIRRKEVSLKVKMAFQQAGMIVLLLFFVFVLYNDIMR